MVSDASNRFSSTPEKAWVNARHATAPPTPGLISGRHLAYECQQRFGPAIRRYSAQRFLAVLACKLYIHHLSHPRCESACP
jgi:hypothetical protein